MLLLIFLSIVIGVYGRPEGAPEKACSSLMPIHRDVDDEIVMAQTTKAPYSVTVQDMGKSKYLVKISSPDDSFRGFILQARSSKNPKKFIDGKFTTSKVSKTIKCFNSENSTLTHLNAEPKHEVVTEWTPKQSLHESVIFRATVAKEYDMFWTEVDSPVVFFDRRVEDPSLSENCFVTEGCSGLPVDCVKNGNCKIMLRYTQTTDSVSFAMHGYIESSHYMAMALSKDQNMGNDSVTECIRDGSNLILRYSWNDGRTNTHTREVPKENVRNLFSDGLSTCTWSEPLAFERNGQHYDFLEMEYFLLFATGRVEGSNLQYHNEDKTPTASPVSLTYYKSNATGDSNVFRVPDKPYSDNGTESSVTPFEQMTTEKAGGHSSSSGFCPSFIMLMILGVFHATKDILRVLA